MNMEMTTAAIADVFMGCWMLVLFSKIPKLSQPFCYNNLFGEYSRSEPLEACGKYSVNLT